LTLVAGVVAARLSSAPELAQLRLIPGEAATVSVFRLFPDSVRLFVRFDRLPPAAPRPELGEFQAAGGPGYVAFNTPGAPVVLRIRAQSATVDFEALPATAYGSEHIDRELVVLKEDGDPRRFQWPPDNLARPRLPAGRSSITITAVEVGAALAGEGVTVVIEPPLTFKAASPGYGFLWWFFIWPLWAAALVAYAAVVAWRMVAARGQPQRREA